MAAPTFFGVATKVDCSGNAADHCCYLGVDGECKFLERGTVPGRRFACGLLRELGSWKAVYEDQRYVEHVKPFWNAFSRGRGCGDWPFLGETCATCGVKNG